MTVPPSSVPKALASDAKFSVEKLLGGIMGFTLGWIALSSVPGDLKARLLGGALAGLLVSLVPRHLATRNGHPKLAAHAVFWTVVAGTILGLMLAAPVALIFVAFAMRRRA